MRVFVYDEVNDSIEEKILCLNDNMPYTTGGKLTVKDFVTASNTSLVWTTKRFLEGVESLIDCFDFDVRIGFQRAWETPDNGFYQHMLGTMLEGGKNLSYFKRVELSRAIEDNQWMDWIGDLDHEPTLLRFHQAEPSDSDLVPFETVRLNDKGTSVFVLQDALWALDYCISGLNGVFDKELDQAVRNFQRDQQLEVDGIAGKETWKVLMRLLHFDEERFNAVVDE